MSCMGPLNFLTVARGGGSLEQHPAGYPVAGTFVVSSPYFFIFGQQFFPCFVFAVVHRRPVFPMRQTRETTELFSGVLSVKSEGV